VHRAKGIEVNGSVENRLPQDHAVDVRTLGRHVGGKRPAQPLPDQHHGIDIG
jgi:hypothetical protein